MTILNLMRNPRAYMKRDTLQRPTKEILQKKKFIISYVSIFNKNVYVTF